MLIVQLFRYPISDHRGTMGGRTRNRVSGRAPVTAPRPVVPAMGNPPSRLPGSPVMADGAAVRLVPGSAVAPGLTAGAAAAQLFGADNAPIKLARPIPAVTASPLAPRLGKPAAPSSPVPEPAPTDGASALLAALARLVAGIRFLSWFAFERTELVIHAVLLAIDVSVLIELNDDDADDVDKTGEASPCSVCGRANITCDSTAGVSVAAAVPLAWATVAPWAATPAGLVACCGGLKGGNIDAAAEAAA